MNVERTTSLPTIQCVASRTFWLGGRMLEIGETVWLTEMDLVAHAGSVRTVLRLSRRQIAENAAIAERFRR